MNLLFIMASILFGLLPESLYFALYIINSKQIRERRVLLFVLIFAANLLLSAFLAYNIWYHVLFIAAIFGIMRLLHKAQLIDIFLITSSALILALLGFICYFSIPNYWIALIVNRFGLFLFILLSRTILPKLYKAYCSMWNRKPGAKIKSITVRNISCIVLNLLLVMFNYIMIICLVVINGR